MFFGFFGSNPGTNIPIRIGKWIGYKLSVLSLNLTPFQAIHAIVLKKVKMLTNLPNSRTSLYLKIKNKAIQIYAYKNTFV